MSFDIFTCLLGVLSQLAEAMSFLFVRQQCSMFLLWFYGLFEGLANTSVTS